jgi:hypothetical protein
MEFLLLEGRPGDEIAQRLHNVFGQDAYCRVSVFRWIQEVRRGNEELRDEGRPCTPCRYEVDAAIQSILEDEPKTSVWIIVEASLISPETVRTHMARIGSTLRAFRWRCCNGFLGKRMHPNGVSPFPRAQRTLERARKQFHLTPKETSDAEPPMKVEG